MEITISLSVYDVATQKCGRHYEIVTPKGITINFSPDALDEFLNDIKAIKEEESKKIINEPGS